MTDLAGRPREYFAPELQDEWLRRWRLPKISSYAEFVEMAISRGTTANGVFGGKLHWYQLRNLIAKLRELNDNEGFSDGEVVARTFPKVRYVWLFRRDKVRQAVSYYRASRTGQWWDIQSSTIGNGHETNAVTFEFAGIDRLRETLLLHESNWREFFTSSWSTPIKVAYEDLARDYHGVTLRLLHNLGVAVPPDLKICGPRLKRQADTVSESWVKQYRELKWGTKPASGMAAGC